MRLLLDLQAIQGGARHRGLGRYSLELAASISRRPEVNDVAILLNGGLGGSSLVEDRATLARRIPNARVVVFEAPWPWHGDWRNAELRHRAEAVRLSCIQSCDPEAIIVCSPFSLPNQTVLSVPARDRPFTAVVTYDFLPLTDQDSLLPEADRPWFAERMESLTRSDLLLCISDFTSQVAHDLLGERCPPRTTIWGSSFTLPKVAPAQRRGVVVAGGDGRRKNEAATIRAFAKLPRPLRRAHPLTVVGRQTHPDLDPQRVAREVGLDPSECMVPGGEISDEALAVLYAHARLVVMPSRGEGLGMPVLEAWHYGTPAVASNVTSLPELIGDTRYTFPPDDHEAQARVLAPLLSDDDAWQEAVAHAAARARLFTWERSAEIAVTSIARAVVDKAGPTAGGRRPTLAFVIASPDSHSGAAALARDVAVGLSGHYGVTVIHAGDVEGAGSAPLPDGISSIPFARYRQHEDDFDRVLVQVAGDHNLSPEAAALLRSGRCCVLATGDGLPSSAGEGAARYLEHGLAGLLDQQRPAGKGPLRLAQALVVTSDLVAAQLSLPDGTGIPQDMITVLEEPAAVGALVDAIERGHRRFHTPASGALSAPLQLESVAANRPDRTGGTIYIDVTSLVETNRHTGIERVSASVCKALAQVYPGRVFPVRTLGDRFAHAPAALPRLLDEPGAAPRLDPDLPVHFRAGDVLFSPENKRDLEQWAELVNSARGRGVGYVQLIHDMLPIRLEDFFLPFARPWYERWMHLITETADCLICNSQATMADLHAWLSEVDDRRELGSRTHWIRLASTLGNSPIVTPELRLRPRGVRRVLAVGTIEPRKAYETLLDAAEALWRRHEDVEFTIVGRPGWVGKDLLNRLAAAEAPGRLTWYRDASDLDLQWEYLTSDLLVMASRGEGFGLPVVEAIAHGVPVLARDLPVFREILGPDGQYFVLDRQLPDAILAALHRGGPPACAPDRIVDWRDTAADLLNALGARDGAGVRVPPRY